MTEYTVVVMSGYVANEHWLVEANSEEEAIKRWAEGKGTMSSMQDPEPYTKVVDVTEAYEGD